MEAVFLCISSATTIFSIAEDLSVDQQHCINFTQFVLNIKLLEEMARQGGYLSNDAETVSIQIISRKEKIFSSAGIDSRRHTTDDGWAINAAANALQKLQDLDIRESLAYEITSETQDNDAHQEYFSDSSAKINSASTVSSHDSAESCPNVNQEASEFVNTTGTETIDGIVSPEDNVDMISKSTGYGSNAASPYHFM